VIAPRPSATATAVAEAARPSLEKVSMVMVPPWM
jgi:hypothetical protein